MGKPELIHGPDHMGANQEITAELAGEIFRAVRGIRYGSVEVVVHDGKVVQIERTEKIRFDQAASARSR